MTGLVLRRLRAHRLLLGAALLSIVLTTCAVAALAAFGSSIGDAGLRRALQEQSADRTLIEVKSGVGVQDPARMDAAVRKAISGAYDGLPVSVASTTRSGPYGLPLSLRAAGSPRAGLNPRISDVRQSGSSPVVRQAVHRPLRGPARSRVCRGRDNGTPPVPTRPRFP
ncbi:hypothetical protein ACFYWP_38625 [Actinacidiphila glaucinigra]|uniref:hypothetical protein n=1 Tax=Actinacidiphila glaucinigra TaxID=235986 RepID=UPI0036A25819